MVTVTAEALQSVKQALADFRTDISQVSRRAKNRAQSVETECRYAVSEAQKDLQEVEEQIAALERKIEELERRIYQLKNTIESVNDDINRKRNRIRDVDGYISNLQGQMASLRSSLSNAEGEQETRICNALSDLSSEINYAESEKEELMAGIRSDEDRLYDLQEDLQCCKEDKDVCQDECTMQKGRRDKMRDKLERLQNAFYKVQSELNDYIEAAGRFENTAGNMAESNKNAVERCIACIDTYLSVSL